MLHTSEIWASPIQQLAEQYRCLADWLEKHDVIPWHVGINWSKDALIIHLKEESFMRIFQGHLAEQSNDTLGLTWTVESVNLVFTCFIPNSSRQQQVQIPTNKESA